eukprot:15441464-Alexandrium_andersonii.AAC.1
MPGTARARPNKWESPGAGGASNSTSPSPWSAASITRTCMMHGMAWRTTHARAAAQPCCETSRRQTSMQNNNAHSGPSRSG